MYWHTHECLKHPSSPVGSTLTGAIPAEEQRSVVAILWYGRFRYLPTTDGDFSKVDTCFPVQIYRETQCQGAIAQIGNSQEGMLQRVFANGEID